MKANRIDEQRLAQVVQSAGVPLTAKQIAEAAVGSSGKRAVVEVGEALEGLRQSGRMHVFPPKQARQPERFGMVPPVEWVRQRLLDIVRRGEGKVTQKQVKDSLHKWEQRYFDEAVGGLIRDGKLHYLTVKYKYVVSFAPTPFDHLLGRQVTALKEILERINRRRSKPLSLDELRSFLDGSSTLHTRETGVAGALTEEMLRVWYEQDVPQLGGVTSVPIPWTWRRYESWCKEHGFVADLGRFHQVLHHLSQARRIELIPHSRTHTIPVQEEEVALSGPSGEALYYWRWR